MCYSILMCLPFLIWTSIYREEVEEKLQFLMSGLEEGLTITIGGLANITDRKKTAYAQVVENTSREETVLRRLRMEFEKDSSQMAEKFETYKAFLKQMAASKKLKFGYTFRRFSQCKFIRSACWYNSEKSLRMRVTC